MKTTEEMYAEDFRKTCPACGAEFVANAEVHPHARCPGCGRLLDLECDEDGSNQRVLYHDPEILRLRPSDN
jgi:uncharacterized protein (DUF983 family)